MTCVHHYILPPADGPNSLGTCKHCGDEKLHKNAIPESKLWYNKPERDQQAKDESREMAEARKAEELDNKRYCRTCRWPRHRNST